MSLKNTVSAIPLTTINPAAFVGGVFTAFPAPLPDACFMIRILNRSNVLLVVSYDGVNFHDIIPADNELVLPLQEFSRPSGYVAKFKQGTVVYLTGNPVGANGFIYLCGYYQESQ